MLDAFKKRLTHEQQAARTDPLTSLSNRRAFVEAAWLELERGRRHGRPLSLLYIDCDDFKLVNDRLGHVAGDAVLSAVGATLRQAVRGLDTVARLGGDEFGVLLPEVDRAGAVALADRLRVQLRETLSGRGDAVTFSIGVATFLRPPASVDEMILRADELMYKAKRSGKDRWQAGSWDATEAATLKLVATCARGTEGAVRGELASLGMRHLRGSRGAVTFEGRMEDGMRACLWSRTAMRVLAPLASFPCPDAAALYDGVRTVDWTEWLNVKTTLAVDATGTAPGLHHTGFVALKVKDGVVDSLRDALGGRPDVDTRDPDVRIVLHLARGQAELSLDLSGAPLYRRGYRNTVTEAPLKETLAASILALGEAALDRPFLDPLCGSGTLAIEHALAARRIAPGLGRAFGFQRWPRYRGEWQSSWDRMKEEARAAVLPRAPAPIRASDRDEEALDAARRNARAAGVEADVEVLLAEARTVEPFGDAGTICTNPPYGERIGGQPLQLAGFYRGLAEAFRRFHGWSVLVLSGNPLLERNLGMRPEWTHRLWNGPLEVNLVRCRVP